MSPTLDREMLIAHLKGEMIEWATPQTSMSEIVRSAVCGILLCKIMLGEFDIAETTDGTD